MVNDTKQERIKFTMRVFFDFQPLDLDVKWQNADTIDLMLLECGFYPQLLALRSYYQFIKENEKK